MSWIRFRLSTDTVLMIWGASLFIGLLISNITFATPRSGPDLLWRLLAFAEICLLTSVGSAIVYLRTARRFWRWVPVALTLLPVGYFFLENIPRIMHSIQR